MGFRFRRSVRLLPGIRLNFSGSGVSTSIGGKGATLNIGRRGARATVGLPGTGLSYSTPVGQPSPAVGSAPRRFGYAWMLAIAGALAAVATCSMKQSGDPSAAGPAADAKTLYVAALSLNCRSQPSPAAPVKQAFPIGTAVRTGETHGDWTKAVEPDCWMSSAFLSPSASSSPAKSHVANAAVAGGAVAASIAGTYRHHHARAHHSARSSGFGGSCSCASGLRRPACSPGSGGVWRWRHENRDDHRPLRREADW